MVLKSCECCMARAILIVFSDCVWLLTLFSNSVGLVDVTGRNRRGSAAPPALSPSSHEPGVHPGCNGKQPVVHPKRPDHLDTHWQTGRSRMAGERHCWRVEQGPHAVEDRIACRFQTCRCLSWGAWD